MEQPVERSGGEAEAAQLWTFLKFLCKLAVMGTCTTQSGGLLPVWSPEASNSKMNLYSHLEYGPDGGLEIPFSQDVQENLRLSPPLSEAKGHAEQLLRTRQPKYLTPVSTSIT